MGELNGFFEIKWKLNRPGIFIAPTREDLKKVRDSTTPDYVVGMLLGRGAVVLLAYESVVKERKNYIRTKEDYFKLMKHELCHCFTNNLAGPAKPRWVAEGVSLYAADQLSRYPKPNKFVGFLNDEKVYQESGRAIDLLVEKYGKQKLLDFLRLLKDKKASTAFKEIYEKPLSYKTFNNLLSP